VSCRRSERGDLFSQEADVADVPDSARFDESVRLLIEGYGFISKRCKALQSDVFQTRLLGRRTLCMKGEPAAQLFYDEARFTREKAAPLLLQTTLLGRGGVQALDGQAHRVRKRMFLSLLTQSGIDALLAQAEREWDSRMHDLSTEPDALIDLFVEVQAIFCRAVCAWAGMPLRSEDVAPVRADLASLIDGAGSVGPRYLRSVIARRRAERWCGRWIKRTRAGEYVPAADSALAVISAHVDANGRPLSVKSAAVELLNVLRPTVAVAHFVLFCALNLRWHPEWRDRLVEQPQLVEPFVQEVRRLHSFFPFAAARVRKTFSWQGLEFKKGRRVLLDLFGTNRDGTLWADAELFRPERFVHKTPGAFEFITQGGGSPEEGHRCPGERLTIALLKLTTLKLVNDVEYSDHSLPADIDLRRLPMLPPDRYLIKGIRARRTSVHRD
jgi:fatty-acid peroxygenase